MHTKHNMNTNILNINMLNKHIHNAMCKKTKKNMILNTSTLKVTTQPKEYTDINNIPQRLKYERINDLVNKSAS